jgi:AcrR family transcriptional regulator
MPSNDQRQRDRREQIVSAARALFTVRGYAAASMADIIEASGLATGTFYRYFDSKEAVWLAVCYEALAPGTLEQAAAPGENGPALVDRLLDTATDIAHGQLTTQIMGAAVASPTLQEMVAVGHEQLRGRLAQAIARAGTPTANEMARADIVICALVGLREQLAVGIAVDLAAIRASLVELLA